MKRGDSHSRASFRVVWDENNLDYLETHKTPKQKIDEPKTPYHGPDGELSPTRDESATVNPDALREALEHVASSSESPSSSSSSSGCGGGVGCTHHGGGRRKSFEDVRREHYSEFKTCKILLQNVKDDDEEPDRSQLAGGVGGIKIEEKPSK